MSNAHTISEGGLARDANGNVADMPQFGDGHAQDDSVHHREAAQIPIRRSRFDDAIDGFAMFTHRARELQPIVLHVLGHGRLFARQGIGGLLEGSPTDFGSV